MAFSQHYFAALRWANTRSASLTAVDCITTGAEGADTVTVALGWQTDSPCTILAILQS
jgi:hypothetical protein